MLLARGQEGLQKVAGYLEKDNGFDDVALCIDPWLQGEHIAIHTCIKLFILSPLLVGCLFLVSGQGAVDSSDVFCLASSHNNGCVQLQIVDISDGNHVWRQALHSHFNNFNGKTACGLGMIPFKTKLDGPANQGFGQPNGDDIIDEAFRIFRVNVLFKNFEIKGYGDKALIYLLVLISHLFKSTENLKDIGQVQKKLSEINGMNNPFPKDKGNFLAPVLEDRGNERDAYLQYIKQMKGETINRFFSRFFRDGLPIEDFKFWSGLARKKFMGMNFMSMF